MTGHLSHTKEFSYTISLNMQIIYILKTSNAYQKNTLKTSNMWIHKAFDIFILLFILSLAT